MFLLFGYAKFYMCANFQSLNPVHTGQPIVDISLSEFLW